MHLWQGRSSPGKQRQREEKREIRLVLVFAYCGVTKEKKSSKRRRESIQSQNPRTRNKHSRRRTTCKMSSLTGKACSTSLFAPGSAGVLGRGTTSHCRSGHSRNSRCRRSAQRCYRGSSALIARVGRRRFSFDHGRVSAQRKSSPGEGTRWGAVEATQRGIGGDQHLGCKV